MMSSRPPRLTQISSASNELFKGWSQLGSSKGIRKQGQFILMGEKLIREFLAAPGPWKIKAELIPSGGESQLGPREAFEKVGRFVLSEPLFKELDVLGTGFHLLVLESRDIPVQELSTQPQGLELVLPLGDPANLGACLRSALAFGVSKVLLTEESAHPFHPKSLKASAGAALKLQLGKIGSLKSYVSSGADYGLDLRGTSLLDQAWPQDLRLIVGEEGPGLPPLEGVQKVKIPTGPVESLNAAVAASLALYEIRRRR